MVQCLSCNDQGYVMFDGVPRSCANGCEASQRWQREGGAALATRPGGELDPMRLPPGGATLAKRDAAAAAGMPPGVLGSDTVVRATLAVEPLVHELVRAIRDITDAPSATVATHAISRAGALLERLPAWAFPPEQDDDEIPEPEPERTGPRRPAAAPLEAPE